MRNRTFALVALALALFAGAAHAATVMVYVEEWGAPLVADGSRPFRDAVLGGLFDRGHIVFDLGESAVEDIDWGSGVSATLRSIAAEGGAALYVAARAETRLTARQGGRPLVEIGAVYFVVRISGDAASVVATGRVAGGNRGSEDQIDAVAVARSAAFDVAAPAAAAFSVR